MTLKEIARKTVEPVFQANEDEITDDNHLSNFNIPIPIVQGRIESLLEHGEENGIKSYALCKLAGIKETSELRKEIDRERKDGALILSSQHGYYLPNTNEIEAEEEIEKFVNRFDSIMRNNRMNVKAAKAELHRIRRKNQISIGE